MTSLHTTIIHYGFLTGAPSGRSQTQNPQKRGRYLIKILIHQSILGWLMSPLHLVVYEQRESWLLASAMLNPFYSSYAACDYPPTPNKAGLVTRNLNGSWQSGILSFSHGTVHIKHNWCGKSSRMSTPKRGSAKCSPSRTTKLVQSSEKFTAFQDRSGHLGQAPFSRQKFKSKTLGRTKKSSQKLQEEHFPFRHFHSAFA